MSLYVRADGDGHKDITNHRNGSEFLELEYMQGYILCKILWLGGEWSAGGKKIKIRGKKKEGKLH